MIRLLCALVAGATLALAFPPQGWVLMAPVGVALLTIACWRRGAAEAFVHGLACGSVLFLVLLMWMRVVGDDAWLLLAAYCALWIGFVGAGTALVTRLPGWPVAVAAVWVASEAFRSRVPWGGFAWGRLAFSQVDSPVAWLTQLAGAPGATFAVGLAGALIAAGLLRLAPPARARWGQVPARSTASGLAFMGLAAGVLASGAALRSPAPSEAPTVTAAVVQGSVASPGIGQQGPRRDVLDRHIAATRALARSVRAGEVARPEFVVWPENASDVDPFNDPVAYADIQSVVDDIGVPTLVGAVIENPADPATVLNVGIVWNPGTGPAEQYAKQHPVPFGEFVPFRSVLTRYIGRIALVPRDFAAGSKPGVLQLGPTRVGNVICFEVADDDVVRTVVRLGARVLTVQTNNATYGRSSQPLQQLAITRLRAIEHRRYALVAATSGISAVIAPDGSVRDEVPEFVADSLVAEVGTSDRLTTADRLGSWPEWIATAVALGLCLRAARRRPLGSGRSAGEGSA